MEIAVTIGARIFQRRIELGLTQAELARAADISPGYLSAVENDRVSPPADDTCRRLANALRFDAKRRDEFTRQATRQRRSVGVRLPRATPPHLRTFIVDMVGRENPPSPTVLAKLLDALNQGGLT